MSQEKNTENKTVETEVLENKNQEETTENKEVEKTPLEKIEQEMATLKDQHLRLFADFENYKKRTAKERIELFGTANQELMSALLPVIDDFKRALKNLEGTEAQDGVLLISNKLNSILQSKGLKPMDDTTGKTFDVDTMEAITRIPAPDKKQKGKVIDEVESGYLLGNKILRYAKVVVGE